MNNRKGVICKIVPKEHMPIDGNGVRADIVMDGGSTVNRMNLGRLYEHYLGAAAYEVTRKIRNQFNIVEKDKTKIVKELKKFNPEAIDAAYNHVLGFYKYVSTRQYEFYLNEVKGEDRYLHLAGIILDGVFIYLPIENEKELDVTIHSIEQDPNYRPIYGPVSYIGNSGKRVVTDDNIRIAPLYMLLLEKIADDWSSVSSGKLQHFGVLSPMTKSEKYAYPWRNSPVRTIGETEGRIFAGYCGREAISEMMDRSNNPLTHKQIVWNILNSNHPMNIDKAIDRNLIPLGGSKPLQLFGHIAMVAGFKPVYEPPNK